MRRESGIESSIRPGGRLAGLDQSDVAGGEIANHDTRVAEPGDFGDEGIAAAAVVGHLPFRKLLWHPGRPSLPADGRFLGVKLR